MQSGLGYCVGVLCTWAEASCQHPPAKSEPCSLEHEHEHDHEHEHEQEHEHEHEHEDMQNTCVNK